MIRLDCWMAQCSLPRRDAQIVLGAVLGWSRAQLLAHPEHLLCAAELQRLERFWTDQILYRL